MRILSSTLLAAQRSGSATPYLHVRLLDRDVGVPQLRWTRWYAGSEADGPAAVSVADDGTLLRARIDPGTGALTHARVATPDESSTYSNWTAAGTVAVGPRLGLSAAGTRSLLATVRTDGVSIEVRESTDSGASFGASTVVATAPSAATAVACALLDGTGTAAIVYAAGGTVYETRRTGTGAWSAAAAWTNGLATVNGLAMHAFFDYEVLVSGNDAGGSAGAWATQLGAGHFTPPGAWDSLTGVVLASAGTGVTYLATGLGDATVPRAAVVESFSGGGAYDRVQVASAVGATQYSEYAWRDPVPFGHASPYGVGLAAASGSAWLVSPDGVWHADIPSGVEDLTEDVLEADLVQSVAGGHLRLVLQNQDGRFNSGGAPLALQPRGELQVAPGYVTAAGAEVSTGPRFWIAAVTRRRDRGGSTVEVEAVDGWGVLRAWSAARQIVWSAGSLPAWQVIEQLLARAGLRMLSSGSSEATAVQPAFTVRAGESGATALRRLLATLPDELRSSSDGLSPYEPTGADPTDYAYGVDHPLLSARIAEAGPRAGWARVFGSGVFAEAVDGAMLRSGGSAAVAVDDNLVVQARADARASTMLRQAALAADLGEIVVPANAGQEVGDVVEVTDTALGLAAARFRVSALRLRYARGDRRPRYDLALTLSEV